MFELINSISIDARAGVARGIAEVAADDPLFADHFAGWPLLPGSLLIELAAQIAGPLAEEVSRERHGLDRWALLGMVHNAKFLHPVSLPATISLSAEATRVESSNITNSVSAEVHGQIVMRGELVMMLVEATAEWEGAIQARHARLAHWKGAA